MQLLHELVPAATVIVLLVNSTNPILAETLSRGVCTENLNTGVVVMKSAQDGACTDHTGSLNRARNRRILV